MWRDVIQSVKASFRGVEFSTVDAEARIGRRNVTHEYPQRDVPFAEDLGRRARQFVVDAYVIGEDYLDQRDALIAAIEEFGPGELVHPRWGTLQVSVQDYVSVRESPREGGLARFSITFCESGENTFPQAIDDTFDQVDTAADALEDSAAECFALEFDATGGSPIELDALGALQSDLAGMLATVRRVTDISALGEIVRSIGSVTTSLSALIRTPVLLAQGLRGIYGQFNLAVLRPVSAFGELLATFSSNSRPSAALIAAATAGSTRARILINEQARADLQRRLALPNAARALTLALQPAPAPPSRGVSPPAAAIGTPTQSAGQSGTVTFVSGRLVITPAATAGAGASTGIVAAQADAPIPLGTTSLVAALAQSAVAITTAAQALQMRDQLLALIDVEVEENDPPAAVAVALVRLRAAVTRDVAQRMQQLHRVSTFRPAVVMPSLLLAHRIYQDATRAEELEQRNAVPHPAFVPARDLEILQ